jgi:NADH-quinone oxidoreductase subunit H
MLEAKRAPFDHAETESEVVAGYAVEYSGPMMMIFLLTEYLHLLISSVHFVLFFAGAWYAFTFTFCISANFFLPHEALFYLF